LIGFPLICADYLGEEQYTLEMEPYTLPGYHLHRGYGSGCKELANQTKGERTVV